MLPAGWRAVAHVVVVAAVLVVGEQQRRPVHAGPLITALITLAANSSPTAMFCGFSSD